VLALVRRVFAEPGKRVEFELRAKHRDGRFLVFQGCVRNLLDDPNINGMLVNLRDITASRDLETQREKMEEQIRQMQKLEALGTLAGGIAHDFNTVLSVIQGFAEITRELFPDQAQVEYNQGQILTAVARAKTLVEKILIFSRRIDKERRPIPIGRVAEEAMHLLAGYLPATIKISHRFDPTVGLVMADPTEIHQIMLNLCINAYDAMADTGGKLTLSLVPIVLDAGQAGRVAAGLGAGSYCRLSVSDTGVGMDADTRSRALEPFFSTKPPGEGTGMGLAVVHGIVKSCDGAIVIESELGVGSTFHVYLPTVATVAPTPTQPMEAPPRGTESILLVDDEPQIVEVFRTALTHLGYTVKSFTSPVAALAHFRENPHGFDVILTDQVMPELTGVQLAEEAMATRPDIPVVLASAYEEQDALRRIEQWPNVRFLHKPFERLTLALTVRKALDQHQLAEEKRGRNSHH